MRARDPEVIFGRFVVLRMRGSFCLRMCCWYLHNLFVGRLAIIAHVLLQRVYLCGRRVVIYRMCRHLSCFLFVVRRVCVLFYFV